MLSGRESFRKSERLCSTKAIEALFRSGKSFYIHNYQVIWMRSPAVIPSQAQMAVSISKKLFRRAVLRNIIKRRIREAYRKNKHMLYEKLLIKDSKIIFMIIFKGRTVPDYVTVQNNIREIIARLAVETNNV